MNTQVKEPYISAKEPYISAKEPYISAKEPYISTKQKTVDKYTSKYTSTRAHLHTVT